MTMWLRALFFFCQGDGNGPGVGTLGNQKGTMKVRILPTFRRRPGKHTTTTRMPIWRGKQEQAIQKQQSGLHKSPSVALMPSLITVVINACTQTTAGPALSRLQGRNVCQTGQPCVFPCTEASGTRERGQNSFPRLNKPPSL